MVQSTQSDVRSFLMTLFETAVARAHPSRCVPPHLPEPSTTGRTIIIGAGKASAAMAQAAEQTYKSRNQLDRISGFVTTRHGYGLPTEKIEVIEAGHPVPDEASAQSAKRTLEAAAQAGPNDLVVCLLSGGASALWSAPVPGLSLDDKQSLTKQLLKSGARISEINCVRKHLSLIKGGRLAAATHPAKLITLAISDVPGDDPAAIGSGPTVADPTTLIEARNVLDHYKISPGAGIAAALANPANETLKPDAPELTSAEYISVAAPIASLNAAAEIARQAGYRVDILGDSIEGEARDVARFHADIALDARQRGERLALLSGGELTVTIKGNGSGGPNQEYALALADALQGASGIAALAGDTDGTDGGRGAADDPAGAVVVEDTVVRANASNLNPANFLQNNDSTNFFGSIGDLIRCGPTQTNVNDFRVILVGT